MTGRRQGPAGRRVSARVRRRRAAAVLAVLAVLGVSLAAWIVGRPDSVAGTSKRALSPAHAVAAPRGLPAAEAGLMPWHLAAPVSREVAVAGPRGKLIVLGGLTDGGVSADGVSALGTAHGGARRIGMLNAPLHDAAAALGRTSRLGLRRGVIGHCANGPGVHPSRPARSCRDRHHCRIDARATFRRRGGYRRPHHIHRGRLRRNPSGRPGAGHHERPHVHDGRRTPDTSALPGCRRAGRADLRLRRPGHQRPAGRRTR